jgi:hypothetical protein
MQSTSDVLDDIDTFDIPEVTDFTAWRSASERDFQDAPYAANTGICCPPPEASPSSLISRKAGNHVFGTGMIGVRSTSQSPFFAFVYASWLIGDTPLPAIAHPTVDSFCVDVSVVWGIHILPPFRR